MASGGDVDLALSLAARFITVGEAEAAASALDAAGIDCHLADRNLVGVDWGMAQAVGGIKILVRDEDLERAQDVLNRSSVLGPQSSVSEDRGPMTEDQIEPEAQCPACGSPDFRSVPRFRIFLLIAAIFIGIGAAVGQPLLAMVALIAVASGAILMPSARCTACSHRWSPPPSRRRVEAPLPDATDRIEEKCPRCGSVEVYRINDRRLKAIPLLFSPAIFVVLPLWLLKSKRRCEACGLTLP